MFRNHMGPTHTVENYLKAILQAQSVLPDGELVQMGQLAASMGVAPGTATTMVKALADSGLVLYEPYAGVRLTPAGEKLAALVLRRHRLIESFLVKVMEMSWTEVHDEAEQLEHAASDRLIELMDQMLGRPAADPHGDPIPGPEGTVPTLAYHSLLTCPAQQLMTIARVTDQDREFLQFAERHGLRPGDHVRVEARDAAGDSVQLSNAVDRRITIGTGAAAKVLVRVVALVLGVLVLASSAFAQAPAAAGASRPFRITDNSFFVEEAFNQEAGIFQNILGATRTDGQWAATFTQEWPVVSQTHQLSYTVGLLQGDTASGVGDTLLNYRYQATLEGPGRAAFSPRLSAVLPTGRRDRGLGNGSFGLQANLPVSKQFGDWYVHWNGGLTWLPHARSLSGLAGPGNERVTLISPFVAASGIYRLRDMCHLMLESVLSSDESVFGGGTLRERTLLLSPGIRGGWNRGDRQIVVGLALPLSWTADTSSAGAFLYFSYELPFAR